MHYPWCLSRKKNFIQILSFGCTVYPEVPLGIHEICPKPKYSIIMGYYISLETLSHKLSNAPIIKNMVGSIISYSKKSEKNSNFFSIFLICQFWGISVKIDITLLFKRIFLSKLVILDIIVCFLRIFNKKKINIFEQNLIFRTQNCHFWAFCQL